jgi:hypothetical protein
MSAPQMFTFYDCLSHLVDYAGGNPQESLVRDAKRSIMSALREFANEHMWKYFYTTGRINVFGPFHDGTVTYTHTEGSYERVLTLAGGVWPSYARNGTVRIGVVDYDVAERKSDTEITLSITNNPGADLPAGTTYILFQDTYPTPTDFIAIDQMMTENYVTLENCHPRDWLQMRRKIRSTGMPLIFCITGDPNYAGAIAIRFYPYSDRNQTVDFIYRRRPRRIIIQEYTTGTVSCSANRSTVTGIGTSFPMECPGAVIRFGQDSQKVPDGIEGSNPYVFERIVTAVNSPTEIIVDAPLDTAISGVRFRISDPIDMELGVMQSAFLRCCEKALSEVRTFKDRPDAMAIYKAALSDAMAADNRYQGPKFCFGGHNWTWPVRMGQDVP